MTIGASLFLIAVGAILRYAVTVRTGWINLQTTGVILMAVGGAGLALSLFLWISARSRGISPPRRSELLDRARIDRAQSLTVPSICMCRGLALSR
jgi:hypothetical protein